jgi:hypothetical protein
MAADTRRFLYSLAVTVAGVVLLAVCPAEAQDPPKPPPLTPAVAGPIEQRRDEHLARSRTMETAPGVASPYALPVPEVTLQTTKDGTEASAVIGVSTPFWGFRTTFKTPIGKEADAEATPLSLSGLANQATVDFAYIRTRVFRNSATIDSARLALCKARGIPNDKCSDQAFTGQEREDYLNLGIHAHPSIFTAHVQVGGKSFDFVERGGSARLTEKFTSIAAGGSYGWLFLNSQSVLAMNVDAARDYAGSRDSTLLCRPLTTDLPGTERCDTRTIGRPTASRKVTTTLDFRKVFSRIEALPATPGAGAPTPPAVPEQSRPVVGLNVQLRIQAIEDAKTVWGLEAPVYFLQKKPDQNKSVALNGGASAGWNSRDGFVARVFIGSAFALISKGFNQ